MVNHLKVREVIKAIILKNNLNQEKFAQSIGISTMMVSYVMSGERKLSNKRIHKLCEVWNVEYESLLGEEVKLDFSFPTVLNDVMRVRGIQMDEMVERTGIDLFSLFEIKRGFRKATKEEIEKICKALNTDVILFDEKKILSNFAIHIELMRQLNYGEESIERVLKVLEEEIKK